MVKEVEERVNEINGLRDRALTEEAKIRGSRLVLQMWADEKSECLVKDFIAHVAEHWHGELKLMAEKIRSVI